MSLKKYIVDLARKEAEDAVDAEIKKLMAQMQSQNSAPFATVKKVKGPNEYEVQIGGRTKTVSYIGGLPKTENSSMIVNGDYGVA